MEWNTLFFMHASTAAYPNNVAKRRIQLLGHHKRQVSCKGQKASRETTQAWERHVLAEWRQQHRTQQQWLLELSP